ncbi:MAG: ABC transporter permease [Gemmatimonadota bacterium]|nr:ABC transporter permease [Gemmatimonadota bacterium]
MDSSSGGLETQDCGLSLTDPILEVRAMFWNYLTVAWRNLLRHPLYAAINVFGLAVGLACCLLVLMLVLDEVSYDRFHEKADRIYRVLWDGQFGDNAWTTPLSPVPVAETLSSLHEVEGAVRMRRERRTLRIGETRANETGFYYVEAGFFDVFTVRFVAGDSVTALRDPDSVVITERTARRYFRGQDPLGLPLNLTDGTTLRVTGVVEGFPQQSHFQFDFLAPLWTLPIVERRKTQWGSATVYTYIVLREQTNASEVEAKLREYVNRQGLAASFARSGGYSRFRLQPMTHIHLRSQHDYELEQNGAIVHVFVFSLIAVLVLFLACVNFVNLHTALSTSRTREIGIRKVLGSRRGRLVRQFLIESSMHFVLALVLAIGLCELAMSHLVSLTGKQLAMSGLSSPTVVLALSGIFVVVAALAGMYPALVLSSFRPADVFTGRISAGLGGERLRNGLVVAQFCVSIGMLIGVFVIRDQLLFVQHKRLGFDRENVLVVHGAGDLGRQSQVFRERLTSLAPVVAASVAQSVPGKEFGSVLFRLEQPANYEQTSLAFATVDENYAEVLGLEVTQGRNFAPEEFPSDSTAFLINRSAASILGWEEPVGKRMVLAGREGQVIGVVKDFHYQSLRHRIEPLVLPFLRWGRSYVVVRLHPGNVADAVASARGLWEEFAPDQPFEYSFLDSDYLQLYENEQRMIRVVQVFSGLAIFIACLGLLGLASFAAAKRKTEIGIRKVLGATVANIVFLLTRDFARHVLIAFVFASPITYYVLFRWQQDFAYRSDIEWWMFAASGGLAMGIALLTVTGQAVRAATANPVEALRSE